MLWQELEFGYPPDAPRLKGNPFRLCATFRLTITSCTPLAQHTPFVQMSAPIPLAADLGPNPDSSALPKSSTSEEAMEPQPKRQCLDELASALGVPPAAVEPPLAAVEPTLDLALPSAMEPFDASNLTISVQTDLHWHVFGNDPNDAHGIRSVLLAEHSRGKPEIMLSSAFPFLTSPRITALVNMPASNVFCQKKGGARLEAVADAWSTVESLIELADEYEEDLRVWGCGGGMDRIVQISTAPDYPYLNPDLMMPLNASAKPTDWDKRGIRKALDWKRQTVEWKVKGRCSSINLDETADGTGTYRVVEIYRSDQMVTHFFLGVYPHPGSQSWGAVKASNELHGKFLRDLAAGKPSQAHVIKINADDFE
jgi:hypothetical protein